MTVITGTRSHAHHCSQVMFSCTWTSLFQPLLSSTARAEGNSPANPWSSSPELQSLSILGLLRAAPHQPDREPEWGSGSDTGLLRWPDRRVILSLRTPDTSQNESSCMCSPQIWDQGLQWKAHHSNLPKDFGYHERLNSGSLSGVTTTLILITPAKWKKNFSPILYVKIPVWGHLVWFIFLQNFIILMWSYTLSVPSCYHGDLDNNWNFLH